MDSGASVSFLRKRRINNVDASPIPYLPFIAEKDDFAEFPTPVIFYSETTFRFVDATEASRTKRGLVVLAISTCNDPRARIRLMYR